MKIISEKLNINYIQKNFNLKIIKVKKNIIYHYNYLLYNNTILY